MLQPQPEVLGGLRPVGASAVTPCSFVGWLVAVLGLHCRVGFSLVVASRGYSSVTLCGLLMQ